MVILRTMRIPVATLLVLLAPAASATDWPLFDAHIHYSEDVWEAIPPDEAIRRLQAVGITGALVSSSPDHGTWQLHEAAPQFVVPALRPYRKRGELDTWMRDQTVIPYLEQRLAQHRYAALGELHVDGPDADLPIVRRVVELAREHDLILQVHGDADAIEILFRHDPQARILWAHAGFEHADRVRELMDRHPRLWADLSFRREIHVNGRFLGTWRELLIEHGDRFMVGIDTYTPQRWLQLQEVADAFRELLDALPEDTAERIAYRNGESLLLGQ